MINEYANHLSEDAPKIQAAALPIMTAASAAIALPLIAKAAYKMSRTPMALGIVNKIQGTAIRCLHFARTGRDEVKGPVLKAVQKLLLANLATIENIKSLAQSGEHALNVANGFIWLNNYAPKLFTQDHRAILVQNGANALELAKGLVSLVENNLATRENIKSLAQSGEHALNVANGFIWLNNHFPWLSTNENRALFVQNGANPEAVKNRISLPYELGCDLLRMKFSEFGFIEISEIALVIAAKGADSVYAVPHMEDLIPVINRLVDKPTKDSHYRFQVVFRLKQHSQFGEVIIDKTGPHPKIKIFCCDPIGNHQDELMYCRDFLSKKAIIELFFPRDEEILQKGKGCSYFSLDGAFMLRNQEKYDDIYKVSNKPVDPKSPTHVISLPIRMKRGCQYYDAIKPIIESAQQEIVNKKGQRASESIKSDLEEIVNEKNQPRVLNKRAERKMKIYREKVLNFLMSGKINNRQQLNEVIEKHSLSGLIEFSKSQVVRASKPSS